MIHGVDTGFLVAIEVAEHPAHVSARATLGQLVTAGDLLALTPQVLAEFIHIVTDPRRFTQPLTVTAAISVADNWWTAREVIHIYPTDPGTVEFLKWMKVHSLGRKRLLDTLLAATFREAGITSVLTTNPADFQIFGCFSFQFPAPTPGSSP